MTSPAIQNRTTIDDDLLLTSLFTVARPAPADDETFVSGVMSRVQADVSSINSWTTAIGATVAVLGIVSVAPYAPTIFTVLADTFTVVTADLPLSAAGFTLVLTMLGVGGTWWALERP